MDGRVFGTLEVLIDSGHYEISLIMKVHYHHWSSLECRNIAGSWRRIPCGQIQKFGFLGAMVKDLLLEISGGRKYKPEIAELFRRSFDLKVKNWLGR